MQYLSRKRTGTDSDMKITVRGLLNCTLLVKRQPTLLVKTPTVAPKSQEDYEAQNECGET